MPSFSLAQVPSFIHLHLSSEKSSAARTFFTKQRKSSLKYDEMWELMVKKGMMEMISWMHQWVWDVKVLCLSEVEEGPAGWARPAVWN